MRRPAPEMTPLVSAAMPMGVGFPGSHAVMAETGKGGAGQADGGNGDDKHFHITVHDDPPFPISQLSSKRGGGVIPSQVFFI
jgi:hypothetical protein